MERKEIKIPVFSVLKKGSILKNIILNSPLPEIQEDDERILIGRHPDCHIVLDHPSISRFHLEVQVKPFLQKLFVVDQSSVHGTWVSGAKIDPCVPVELVEGDTLRFGASTRVYRLHWVLQRDALEMGNPLEALIEEKEDAHQDEGLGNPKERWVAEIPSAPPLPESVNSETIDKLFLKELEVNENLTAEMPLVKDARSSSSLLSRRKKSVGLLCIPNGRNEDVMKEKHCHVLSADVDGNDVNDCIISSRGISEGQTAEEKFDYGMDDVALEVSYDQMFQESLVLRSSSNWSGYLNVVDDKYCLGGEVVDIVKQEQCILDDCKNAAEEEEEEEAFVSDKENMTPVVSNGQRSLKTRFGVQRSPFKAIAALNLEDEFLSDGELKPVLDQPILKNWENPNGEEVEEEEEVAFVSDKENVTPIVSTGQRKTRFGLQRSPTEPIAALNLEDEFLSDGELKPVLEQPILKNWENPNGEEVEEGEEVAFVLDKENMTPIVSTGQKSQTQFGVQSSPTKAIAALKLEDEFLSYGKLKPKQSVLQECMKVLEEKQETIVLDKENMTPVETHERRSEKSCMKIQKSSSNAIATLNVVVDSPYPDRENWTPEITKDLKLKNYTSENILSRNSETAFSDKENWTPKVSRGQKSKRRAEKFTMADNEEPASGSNKENLTPDSSRALKSRKSLSRSHTKIEEQIMKKRLERIPFQSLLENSPMKTSSSVSNNQRDANKTVNPPLSSKQSYGTSGDDDQSIRTLNQSVDQMHNVGHEKKKWNIVADASCFLTEESRRSLQLLEGLKGTHLIIPMMVIRELDCMKQHERWYQKTPKASSALQWIKDCMVRTSWWIHVQNSSETLPVPPTPPASPRLQFTENSMAFSVFGGLTEILSPTAEDHILDCALLFKRIKTDGHLVLLSNNTTLKIKAMAEGLLCETPVEFRESLVNPFSKRFLWVDSSPRGSTWSLSEEMSFTQNYYDQLPNTRKVNMAAENAKGLKLILLHNSHYRQANSVK
ncbi:FHA domain-containing protein PS1 [Dioscorea cayenensis subsp. rotundata]|uniref:FHA domain-containing protein PS1 n=1 Tax=Dioscorea cayennensis subsp. rotundata TaxID=55577 RepID=A0AB40B288_DIOCR|nr:FHA domain-containing protein PS1 [Dioscorea cayenensis subsp. rotundata]